MIVVVAFVPLLELSSCLGCCSLLGFKFDFPQLNQFLFLRAPLLVVDFDCCCRFCCAFDELSSCLGCCSVGF